MPPDGSILTLVGPLSLLKRVGIHIGDGTESEQISGRFPSLPGSIYHDIGFVGLLVCGLILGIVIWLSGVLLSKFEGSVLVLGIASAVYTIAYISPLLLATNIMSFPFVCFGFVAVPIFAYITKSVAVRSALPLER
jgi:hypothetical protein